MPKLDNGLPHRAVRELVTRLPSGWHASLGSTRIRSTTALVLALSAPDGTTGHLELIPRQRFEPRDARMIGCPVEGNQYELPRLVVTSFLSPIARHLLKELRIGYVDLTGNVHLTLSHPGLFLSAEGLRRNPVSEPRPRRSLRGAKVGRVVRLLVDNALPLGVRALAKHSGMDPGYVSRLLAFLDAEALVCRSETGGNRTGRLVHTPSALGSRHCSLRQRTAHALLRSKRHECHAGAPDEGRATLRNHG
ncbi:MAG: hypothetical protein QM784_31455 [Polyangiaceae bacterium]